MGWMFAAKGESVPDVVGAHLAVKSIQEGRVELEIAALNFGLSTTMRATMQKDVAQLPMQRIVYVPGQPLLIPINGGGTLTLRGEVLDHQPKFAWKLPLET